MRTDPATRRSHRRVLGAGAVAALAVLVSAGAALANAPNPTSEHVSTTRSGDRVTVRLSGSWDWGNVTTEPGE